MSEQSAEHAERIVCALELFAASVRDLAFAQSRIADTLALAIEHGQPVNVSHGGSVGTYEEAP